MAARPSDEIRVVDNSERRRYKARLGDRVLSIVDYDLERAEERISLVHTYVLPDSESKGGRQPSGEMRPRIRPLACPETSRECGCKAAYLDRHKPEYEYLVAG